MAFFYVYVTGKNVNTIYPGILNQNLSFNWIFFFISNWVHWQEQYLKNINYLTEKKDKELSKISKWGQRMDKNPAYNNSLYQL